MGRGGTALDIEGGDNHLVGVHVQCGVLEEDGLVGGPAGNVGLQVRIRTNSLEFEFAPNSHEFVVRSELEFATSNSNPP